MTDQASRRDSKSSFGVTISCTNKSIKSLRDGPLEITEGGWVEVKNFRCMNFFKPTCLQDFFFPGASLH